MTHLHTKIWDRNYIIILIVVFFHFMSVYLLLPIMPFYLTNHFKATNTEMAVILAGFTISALIVCPIAGYIIDTFKRKPVIILFNIVFILICLFYLIANNLWSFGIDRAFNGAAYSMVTVFGFTMAVNAVKRQFKDEAMLYYGIVSKIGMAIAPAISILIFVVGYDFKDIFILSAIFSAMGLVAMLFVNQKQQRAMEVKVSSTFDKRIYLRVIPETIALSLLTFTYGMINNYMATIGIRNRFYAMENIIFFAMLALGMVSFRLIVRNKIKRANFPLVVMISAAFITISIISMGRWDNQAVLYIAAYVMGGCFETLTVTFRRIFIDMAPEDRVGIGSSNYYMAWDFGMGAGVVTGSILSHHESFLHIFGICSILLILGAVLFRVYVFNHYMKGYSQNSEFP